MIMSSSEHDRDDKAHDTSPNIESTRAINGHVFHSLDSSLISSTC